MEKSHSPQSMPFDFLIAPIANGKLNEFKNVVKKLPSREWCQKKTRTGYTLLQYAIRNNKKDFFDYIVQFCDMADFEILNVQGETALEMALKTLPQLNRDINEYFVRELIERGAFIYGESDKGNLLHLCVNYEWLNITKLLLDKGINPNVRNQSGNSPLYELLKKTKVPHDTMDELVATLLCCGADPSLKCDTGLHAFELAVKNEYSDFVQEMLFFYIFDKNDLITLQADTLLLLAKMKSDTFFQLIEYKLKCEFDDIITLFYDFLNLDIEILRILTEKHYFIVKNFLKLGVYGDTSTWHPTYFNDVISVPIMWIRMSPSKLKTIQLLKTNRIIEKINVFLNSTPAMFNIMLELISHIEPDVLMKFLLNLTANDENSVTEMLIFFIQYGLECYDSFLHTIYNIFGYCPLFNFLLHQDMKLDFKHLCYKNNVMVLVVYDLNFNLREVYNSHGGFLNLMGTESLLDYFASDKLTNSLLLRHTMRPFSEEILDRIKTHPKVPLLVEMARDAARKFITEKFNLKNAKDFYCLVNGLPIPNVSRRIITFETKLYA